MKKLLLPFIMLFASGAQAATIWFEGTLSTACSVYTIQSGPLSYNTAEVFSTMGTPAQFQVSQNSANTYYVEVSYPSLLSSPIGTSASLSGNLVNSSGPNSANGWTDTGTSYQLTLSNSGTDIVDAYMAVISNSGPLPQGYYYVEQTVSCLAI